MCLRVCSSCRSGRCCLAPWARYATQIHYETTVLMAALNRGCPPSQRGTACYGWSGQWISFHLKAVFQQEQEWSNWEDTIMSVTTTQKKRKKKGVFFLWVMSWMQCDQNLLCLSTVSLASNGKAYNGWLVSVRPGSLSPCASYLPATSPGCKLSTKGEAVCVST